ncbi:MAG: flavodoxin domain-containing protein [Kofleriaceae bacterium]
MKRVLILFASNHGQTRTIAFALQRELRELGIEVVTRDAAAAANELPALGGFDAVVLGSRIQYGRHAPAIIAYIRTHRDALAQMPTMFFSVSMAAANGGDDPNGYLDTLFSAVGWRPRMAVAIGGALPYRRYNFLLRFMMKRIARAAGHSTDTTTNHEYTRWDQVRALAPAILELAGTPWRASHAS